MKGYGQGVLTERVEGGIQQADFTSSVYLTASGYALMEAEELAMWFNLLTPPLDLHPQACPPKVAHSPKLGQLLSLQVLTWPLVAG